VPFRVIDLRVRDRAFVPSSDAMQFGQLTVRWASEHAVLAQRNQVLIVNYRGPITGLVMDATETVQRTMIGDRSNPCLMLSIVEHGLPLPDEHAREMMIAHFKRVSSHNHAFATVVLGDGFWTGAARSILSGFSLVARPPCPSTTCADIPTGVRFLSSHAAATPIDVVGLVTDVEAMRFAASRAPLTGIA
jgi:hypothetical protein